MSADQLNYPDPSLGTVAVDAELVGGKRTPMHGVRDGRDEALGAKADAAATSQDGAFSLISLFKRLLGRMAPTTEWTYAAASGGETGTSDVAAKAAAGVGLRNYITWLTVENVHASVDTEFVVKDGSTVIYRGFVKANGVAPLRINFPSPLKSSANTAVNVACITTGSKVYFNCGGFAGA